MNFADAMREESKWTLTENGAIALNTTSDKLLDLYGTIGALRNADDVRVTTLFAEAYNADPLFATKILFYARDIRGGLGERKVFRTILEWLAKHHPEAVRPNLDLIGVFGRYDDLYCLVGTPLENDMWAAMKKQFEEDKANMEQEKAISLLAKWIKTADASSTKTRKLGILTAQKLGYSVYDFKRLVRKMRKRIGVVEGLMSTGQWDKIKYPEVPSRAMMIYRNAFQRHDADGFADYLASLQKGETKINAGTLYPYDIVEKYANAYRNVPEDMVLEAQWKALPNYVEEGTNALVIADTSGSMTGRPLATSVGLAIYFAERNSGAYHNMFMTFSDSSDIVMLKGTTLYQKFNNAKSVNWGWSTNLQAAFDKVLNIAIKNHVSQEEMPKALIVISDMEINMCMSGQWTFYDTMRARYAQFGYEIPNVIFWNVNSRHDVFHADASRKGVQLASGQSVAVFKSVLENIGYTPVEAMQNVINSERYSCVTIEE